ncbi:MAG: hypothetical protein WCI43_09340, partial [Candidatus Firestonebacteria bacterium]
SRRSASLRKSVPTIWPQRKQRHNMVPQEIIDIQVSELIDRAKAMQAKGARLVQICCTKLADKLEIHYSFDKDFAFTSFRISIVDTSTLIPSITGVYLPAFIYENG